jgi:GWxTD domain-containing protein
MKKLILLLFISFQLFAQNELNLEFDYAQFRYDSTSNYFEIYYSFDQEDLTQTVEDGVSVVKALMHIQIQNTETDELVVNKDWKLVQPVVALSSAEKSKALLGALGFILKKGEYTVNISVKDEINDNIKKAFTENVYVSPFYSNGFVISDIELASRIINDNTNTQSIFYKNTLEVFPNPSILYSYLNPVLFYYSEIYGLNVGDNNNPLELTKVIINSNNQVIDQKKKSISREQESIVEIGFFNLIKEPTDTYTLVLSLSDSVSKKTIVSSKKFFFVNPDVVATNRLDNLQSDYMSSEFAVYLDEECDDLFAKSKIIASSKEIDEYESLDSLNHKRDYLFKFWQRRDNNPNTQVNEFKKEFFERINTANARYKTMSNEGYKTDRGRVFLKLGEPDEIDRHPNETDTKPYEVWYYNQVEGGVVYIFADLTGFNYYELLHSTKRGELQDPNWQRRIQTN